MSSSKAKHIGAPKDAPASDQRDDIIDRLYEVAIDPLRLEDLLDQWETMIRPIREEADGNTSEVEIARGFTTHFTRAGKFLSQQEGSTKPVNQLANIDNSAAFIVARDLRILDVNKPAKMVLNIQKQDTISNLPFELEDLEALQNTIGKLLQRNSDSTTIFRARCLNHNRIVILQLQCYRPEDTPPVVVAITSEVRWPVGHDALLKSAFSLTTAEIDIVTGLSECMSLKEIAQARGRSIDTIRAQLKSVMGKTETRSQSELVRLTLSMMDIAAFTHDAADDAPAQSTGFDTLLVRPFQTLELIDGRKLDYLILGDPHGKPCLYLPQDYGLVRWPASAEAAATCQGIKVVVPVRAGYGASTPPPPKTALSRCHANDMAQLLDHLNVEKCPIISMGGDTYFAAYFNHFHPGRMTALIACAGTFPLHTSDQYERMDKWHRFILASARYTPHLLPFMVKAGFLLARKLGKRGFVNAVYGNSDADVKTFASPEVFEAMVCGSEVCLSNVFSAHKAFSAEVITHEGENWTDKILAMQGVIPVHYFNGLQDPQVPAETLREFQAEQPWIDFHIYEDAGQLIFFLKWRDVLKVLQKYL